jgi:hypothetical protein
MKHKHADLIHAWADGAQIQWLDSNYDWCNIAGAPSWSTETTYRIKPEPKPDVVVEYGFEVYGIALHSDKNSLIPKNLRLTFDGETGKLKSAEVL